MTNLPLMAVEEELFDEPDEVSNLPTYDKLHNAFKEFYDDWIRISKTNASLKKKML